MNEERRQFARVPLACRVVLEDEKGERSEGHSIDVSVNGMQLQLDNSERLSSPVKFQAFIGEKEPSFTIEGEAGIARQSDGGQLGLTLLKIDVEGLTHLQRLVDLELGRSEQTAEEFFG